MADVKISELTALTTPDGAEELVVNDNGVTKKIRTDDLFAGDNVKAKFGASDDLQIYHDGSASYIKDAGTGHLKVGATDLYVYNSGLTNVMFSAVDGGAFSAYHSGSKKFDTTSTGVDVTGTVTADGLTVDDGEVLVRSHNSTSNTSVPTIRFDDVDTSQAAGQKAGQILFESSDVSPNSNGVYAYINAQATNTSGTGNLYFGTGITNSAVNRLRIADTGDISFYEDTGTTAKFFWDASAESLAVGASAPAANIKLHVQGPIGATNGTAAAPTHTFYSDPNTGMFRAAVDTLAWSTGGSERARIDSSGKVGIGTTNPSGLLALKGNAGAGNAQLHITQQSANTPVVAYMTDASTKICDWQWYGTTCGSITVSATGTAVAYNTSSDYRLKEDWQAMSGATDRVKALKPINFAWKVDGSRVDGFLAHELAEVVPEAATGTKDAMRTEEYEISPALGEVFVPAVEASFIEVSPAVAYEPAYYDIDGNVIKPEVEAVAAVHEAVEAVAEQIISTDVEQPTELPEGQQWRETTPQVMGEREVPDYQGIDQSKLVPLLTAALQEALERIEALEAKVS